MLWPQCWLRYLLIFFLSVAWPMQGLSSPRTLADVMLVDSLVGVVAPIHESKLAAPIAARVDQYHVQEGDRFLAGDLLITLECAIREAKFEQAQVNLEAAIRENAAQEQLAMTGSTGLLELEMSRLAIIQNRAALLVSQAEKDYCSIVAPYDGVVFKHHKNIWEYVNVGEPLIDIADITTLIVEFLAPSILVVQLQESARFDMYVMELERTFFGHIRFIDPRVDPVSGMMRIKGELEGPFNGLLVGITGHVNFDMQFSNVNSAP